MIVNETIDRFASNFGRMPTSIALAADWTTPLSATNLELAGSSFSSEKDFGDGLSGLGSLGQTNTGWQVDFSNFVPDVGNWDWHEWLLAIGGGYTIYQILFGPKATTRRKELKLAEESYRKRKKRIKEDYSFSPFGTTKKSIKA